MELISLCSNIESTYIQIEECVAGGVDVAFDSREEGTWGAHKRKSAINCALSHILTALNKGDYDDDHNFIPKPDTEAAERWKRVSMLLLEKGANVNAVQSSSDWRGCGNSTTAFEQILILARNPAAGAELLASALAHGGNANMRKTSTTHSMRTDGSSSRPVLHSVANDKSFELFKVLIDAGADIEADATENYHNERGYNQSKCEKVIHVAARAGSAKCLRELIQRGVDINSKAKRLAHVENPEWNEECHDDPRSDGYISPIRCVPVVETALHCAISSGDRESVHVLLLAGAEKTERIFGAEKQSLEEVCDAVNANRKADGDNDDDGKHHLSQLLEVQWTPHNHALLPASTRAAIRAFLLCCLRLQRNDMPKSIRACIFSLLI